MKNKLLLSAFLCFMFMELGFAQMRFGARVSGSMTNITNVHSYSKSRGGFQVAAMAMIPITNDDLLFFQPEINYSAQGEFDQPKRPDKTSVKQKVFTNFINVPLNMKMYFTDAQSEFFALAGPYLGFKVSEKTDVYDFKTEADDNEYAGFDFGVNIGIGYSLQRQVEFSLRYSYGLVDQVKNDAANKSNNTSILNLGVGYFF
ncbi:MAG TPA: porin family protein [Moheibacter sp.]|nr:porin family protein [Moheibacter sp.]